MNAIAKLNGRFHLEVAAWAAITVLAWAISAHFNVFDMLVAFSREHERWQIDEAFLLILFVSIASFAASFTQSRQHLRGRREAEREAFLAARRDVLTNLPNRRMFTELAGTALGEAWLRGGRCSVLFIDLDGFKPVNDTHGHAVGDGLLIAFADLLRDQVPRSAVTARFGGDEFAILLPDFAEELAEAVGRQIQRTLKEPIQVQGYWVKVGATIGIATGPEHGRRAEDLIHAADLAMYTAKRRKRGTIQVYGSELGPSAPGADAPGGAQPPALVIGERVSPPPPPSAGQIHQFAARAESRCRA